MTENSYFTVDEYNPVTLYHVHLLCNFIGTYIVSCSSGLRCNMCINYATFELAHTVARSGRLPPLLLEVQPVWSKQNRMEKTPCVCHCLSAAQ